MLAERAEAASGSHVLEQRLRYTYDSPARSLRHRLVVVPPAVHGRQRRTAQGFTVSGDPASVRTTTDAFGNHVVDVRADVVQSSIESNAWSVVDVSDGALRDVAREFVGACADVGLAERICTRSYEALTYGFGFTDVHTTAAAHWPPSWPSTRPMIDEPHADTSRLPWAVITPTSRRPPEPSKGRAPECCARRSACGWYPQPEPGRAIT